MKISKGRVKELQFIEVKMKALENAGVNNWEGYGVALEEIAVKILNETLNKNEHRTVDSLFGSTKLMVLDAIKTAINSTAYSTELPNEEEKESKKIKLLNWIRKDVDPEVDALSFRSGFEYCYRWLRGDLKN